MMMLDQEGSVVGAYFHPPYDDNNPNHIPGVVAVPRGSKGPRSLFLRRCGDSFGFTLRHFIVYPPDDNDVNNDSSNCQMVGGRQIISAPMDTIFVLSVRSTAQAAGLQPGDRVVAVNRMSTAGRSYQEVVRWIAASPDYLHLLVVPKEEDVLQRFFPDKAYNPASNQETVQQYHPAQLIADHAQWQRLLQSSNSEGVYSEIPAHHQQQQQRPIGNHRAQPQVPLYRKTMGGRRASDGGPAHSDQTTTMSRRESSTSSMSSSSVSTLVDDTERLSRVRQSVRQKEEFLLSHPVVLKEFHSRPVKRLDRPVWPPNLAAQSLEGVVCVGGGGDRRSRPAHKIDWPDTEQQQQQRVRTLAEARRNVINYILAYLFPGTAPPLAIGTQVYRKAKEFETSDNNNDQRRLDFSRSELARLTKKVLQPNVTTRAHEYEQKTTIDQPGEEPTNVATPSPPPPQQESDQSVLRRLQRNSLDSPRASGALDSQLLGRTSGNVLIQSGSKYIHCPPPGVAVTDDTTSSATGHDAYRARSNSAESWQTAKANSVVTTAQACEGAATNVVLRRQRPAHRQHMNDDRRRPDSYLRATNDDTEPNEEEEENDSSCQNRARFRKYHPSPFYGDIDQLRKMFEEPMTLNVSAATLQGEVMCKLLEIDGKKAPDRSWRPAHAVVRDGHLFLMKDRHAQSPPLEVNLADGVDLRCAHVRVADDYTKRKNVLRLTSSTTRAELLLQTESAVELATWAQTLQSQLTKAAVAAPSSGGRSRSPTGQSPVSKTRKTPYSGGEPEQQQQQQQLQLLPSPTKSASVGKTWRGRWARQFKKINHHQHPPTAHEPTPLGGSTFGVPIDMCLPSTVNPYVPRFVEVCTDIIESKGLNTLGIYRVSGNNAAITALSEEVNRNFEEVPLDDARWNDLHVVSSLLKAFLRKMPDSLVTNALYPLFIKADKIDDNQQRMLEIKQLIHRLPPHNFHTLKHVIGHLKKVADNAEHNRMEAKNLAIVFGPTIVRPEPETMEGMLQNMTNQCKIVENLIANSDWFFGTATPDLLGDEPPELVVDNSAAAAGGDEFDNRMLMENLSKFDSGKEKENHLGAVLLNSLFTAAQRKVSRNNNNKQQKPIVIQAPPPICPQPAYTDFSRRIELFKQETEEMLQRRPKITEVVDIKCGAAPYRPPSQPQDSTEDSLLMTMTKLMDQKLAAKHLDDDDVIVDGKQPEVEGEEEEEVTYKDPTLHKSLPTVISAHQSCADDVITKPNEQAEIDEKERADIRPDNDRTVAKLKRSESLKMTAKQQQQQLSNHRAVVRRSESLKVKRSDSLLTKSEKTMENNKILSLRRNNNQTNQKRKQSATLLGRRHTVGGTKDPDKVTYAHGTNGLFVKIYVTPIMTTESNNNNNNLIKVPLESHV